VPKIDLEKTIERARRRLREIQRSSEKTKKRYLAVLSTLAMIIIVGLWFFYLNLTLPQPHADQEIVQVERARAEKNDDSFFKTISRGAENIFNDLKNQITELKNKLGQAKEFTLEPGGAEFSPEEEPLEPTPLP
jgi:hypothetical protein